MEVKKNNHLYSIIEKKNIWSIKQETPKFSVSLNIPKEICKTADETKQYILENKLF